MASIKDAVEESFLGGTTYIKYALWGGLVYFTYQLYIKSPMSTEFIVAAAFTYLILTGFLLETTYNVQQGDSKMLPSFNVFGILWQGLKGLVALGPAIVVNVLLAAFVNKWIINFMVTQGLDAATVTKVSSAVVYGLFGSFILTAYLLYVRKFKISDAYDFSLISKYCMDILIAVIFYLFFLAIANFIVVGTITYLFAVLIGIPNPVCTYFWCMAVIWNLAITGHYMAQINYETIEVKEEKFN